MPFYAYHQNHVRGEWEKPAFEVYIEADTAEIADERIVDETKIYFDGVKKEIDCECCGDRWVRATKSGLDPIEDIDKHDRKRDGVSQEEYGLLARTLRGDRIPMEMIILDGSKSG